jgi:hypothetical protein
VALDSRGRAKAESPLPRGRGEGTAVSPVLGGGTAENLIPRGGGHIEGSDPRGGGGIDLELYYLGELEFIFKTAAYKHVVLVFLLRDRSTRYANFGFNISSTWYGLLIYTCIRRDS